jgi:parallel beta-helix repeat protein
MKKGLFKKGIVLVIILLFFGVGIIPSTVGIRKEKTQIQVIGSRGYIQDLIDNASDGDTIFIPSGIYYENIIINKTISLIGEDKDTTIIDGEFNGDVVSISADWVNISGFTIQNGGNEEGGPGIDITSAHNTIIGNIITHNSYGIILRGSHNSIKNNIITYNSWDGIHIAGGNNNNIIGNLISSNYRYGIHLHSNNSTIAGNIINLDSNVGMHIIESKGNLIERNDINLENRIIELDRSSKNIITKNNFKYIPQKFYYVAMFGNQWIPDVGILKNIENIKNIWSQNYWNRPRLLPKLILGGIKMDDSPSSRPYIIWFQIDWRPALSPYDIDNLYLLEEVK